MVSLKKTAEVRSFVCRSPGCGKDFQKYQSRNGHEVKEHGGYLGDKKPRPAKKKSKRLNGKRAAMQQSAEIKFCGFCGHKILNAVNE